MPVFRRNDHQLKGKVSILVPVRNEEKNIVDLIESIKKINYSFLEIILLNDRSTDRSEELITQHIKGDKRFRIIQGEELPIGWVGKVFACHQLGNEATGDYLMFLDADVRVHPEVVHQSFHIMEKQDSKLITGFPRFPIKPFLGKLLVPLQHFFVFFHLPNIFANKTTIPAFTAAHGAFMFFERDAYSQMGGHSAVKGSLIEDIHITRKMKQHGFKSILVNITPSVTCMMYDTNEEVWQGFLKNIYVGLGRSPIVALFVALFYLTFYFIPIIMIVLSIFLNDFIFAIPLILVWIQTFLIDRVTKQSYWHFILMPFAAVALSVLLLSSMIRSINKKGYVWKGRTYQ